MATDRTAEVTWHGDLMSGGGRIDSVTSGAFGGLDVDWVARSQDAQTKTSPEELIAAAHAACFSMALSNGLAQSGNPADELKASATVTFQPGGGITKIALQVAGKVPGTSEEEFRQPPVRRRSGRAPRRPRTTVPCRKRLPAPPRSVWTPDSRANLGRQWPAASNSSSTSSNARTRRRRSACPTLPSTTTTGRLLPPGAG